MIEERCLEWAIISKLYSFIDIIFLIEVQLFGINNNSRKGELIGFNWGLITKNNWFLIRFSWFFLFSVI